MAITTDQIDKLRAGQAAAHAAKLHRLAHLLRVIADVGQAVRDGDDLALALTTDDSDGVIARGAAVAEKIIESHENTKRGHALGVTQ